MTILDPKKLQSMEQFMRDMSTVLVRRQLRVKMDTRTKEYAYTTGDLITVNPTHMDWNKPVRAWLQCKGMFYHEVMHCIADPVEDYQALPAQDRHYANALGDQAGEVRMAGMYPGAKPYFAMNVYEFLLQKPEARTYSLVYGRRTFLPRRLVKTARKLMLKEYTEAEVREMEQIVDDYTKLAATEKDTKVFANLAARFRELMEKRANQELPGLPEEVRGGKMSPEARKVEVQVEVSSGSEAEEPEQESEDEDESEGEPGGKGESEDESSSDDEGESDDKGDEESDEDSEGSGKSDDEESEQEEGGHGAGTGEASKNKEPQESKNSLKNALEQAIEEAMEEAVEQESTGAGKEALELGLMGGVAESNTVTASHEMAALLRKIQEKARSGFDGGKRAGRLNLRAVRQSRGLSTEIFSQWTPDRRMVNKMSVSVCVDRSGSMMSTIHDVNQVAAAIAMACEEASPFLNRIMIRYFEYQDHLAKKPGDKFDPRKHLIDSADGGTNPYESIRESINWLRGEQGTKLLVIVTDSSWSDYGQMRGAGGFLDQIAKAGIQAQVYHVNGSAHAPHGLPVKAVTMDTLPEDVFELVQTAVREQARRSLA